MFNVRRDFATQHVYPLFLPPRCLQKAKGRAAKAQPQPPAQSRSMTLPSTKPQLLPLPLAHLPHPPTNRRVPSSEPSLLAIFPNIASDVNTFEREPSAALRLLHESFGAPLSRRRLYPIIRNLPFTSKRCCGRHRSSVPAFLRHSRVKKKSAALLA